MPRTLLLVSVAGKVAAAVLWFLPAGMLPAAACFFLPDLYILFGLFVPSSQALCRVYTRFETGSPEVWLTIDDGPDPDDTPRILDLLDRHAARATFFLVGERAGRLPSLVAEILRRGHQVGHHTQTHPAASFWRASPARLRAELDGGLDSLGKGGAAPRWFRPPVGIKNLFLAGALRRRGLSCVGWSARSLDTMSTSPDRVAARVMGAISPGGIIVMHEGPALDGRVRVRAIELLLQRLSAANYACVLPNAECLR